MQTILTLLVSDRVQSRIARLTEERLRPIGKPTLFSRGQHLTAA